MPTTDCRADTESGAERLVRPAGRGPAPALRQTPIGIALAAQTVEPTDLTRLALLNRKRFPRESVYRGLDGPQAVAAHGRREMPIWGVTFQIAGRDTNQEAEVEARILGLVDYLRSMQRD